MSPSRGKHEVCLAAAEEDELGRRPFSAPVTVSSRGFELILTGLVDGGCSGAHTIINESIVDDVCEKLRIEPVPLSRPKPLRGFDGKLSRKPITHMILPSLTVQGHKEASCPMLIAPLGQHDIILGKPWMNKHGVILDILRDKILFAPGRCDHDGNATLVLEDLTFVLPKNQLPKPTIKDADEIDPDNNPPPRIAQSSYKKSAWCFTKVEGERDGFGVPSWSI